jgi:hypothetical protein
MAAVMAVSVLRQPRLADARHRAQALQPRAKHLLAGVREFVRTPAIFGRQRLDPLALLEPRDGAVERARPELEPDTASMSCVIA